MTAELELNTFYVVRTSHFSLGEIKTVAVDVGCCCC